MQVKLRQVIKESKDGNKLLAFLGPTYNLQVHMNRPSLQRSPVEEKSLREYDVRRSLENNIEGLTLTNPCVLLLYN